MKRDVASGDVLSRDMVTRAGAARSGRATHRAVVGRHRTLWSVLLALALISRVTPALAANSWRCAARLVGAGQSIADVYDLCGEPTARAVTTELVTVRPSCRVAVTRAVPVERWTYNLGPRQFVRYLTFREGTLVEIDEGGYGN